MDKQQFDRELKYQISMNIVKFGRSFMYFRNSRSAAPIPDGHENSPVGRYAIPGKLDPRYTLTI